MEKYEYYQKCLEVLKDLIDEYEKGTIDRSRNYSAVFYYLFLDETKKEVNPYLVDILENIYEIAKIHDAIDIVWKKSKSSYMSKSVINFNEYSLSKVDFFNSLNNLKDSIDKEIKRHNEEIVNKYKNDFINDLIDACAYLQRNKDYLNSNENSRNDYLRDLMEFKGYLVKDQSRTGFSENGKEAGETDLIIHNTSLSKNIIIECMNLNKSNNKSIIENHYDKLMTKYDANGNPYNVLISYVKSNDFVSTSLDYMHIIKEYEFKFKASNINDFKIKNKYKEISLMKSEHQRNDSVVFIYHILIHIVDLEK